MVATTPTWEIPYAEPTDELCDGCTITESMATRIDEILTEFDVAYTAASVIPLARASKTIPQNTLVSGATITWDAVDFDTTGIADLNVVTHPIVNSGDDRWMWGGYMQWDTSATSGNEGWTISSAQGSDPLAYSFRQRVAPTVGLDQYGNFAAAGNVASIFSTDRTGLTNGTYANVYKAFVWAWRVGPET